jgi:transposase
MICPEKQLPKRHSRSIPTETEELRKELRKERLARERLERENERLHEKIDRLEARVEELLRALANRDDFYQKEIRKLQKDVADRDEKLESANKQLAWFRKTYFDVKTEEHPDLQDEESPEETQEPAQPKEKRKRGQQKGSKGHGRSDVSQLSSDEQLLEIKDCNCNSCGKAYRQLPRTENSPLVDIFSLLLLTNYRRCIYVPDCNCEGGEIRTADPPPKLFERTKLGNSIWVHLIVQKFLFGVPTNRTLKAFSLKGLSLSQGTVTGGFQKIDRLLIPLYESIVDHCRGGEYWNGDETTWRVFGSGQQKWWLWIVASDDAIVYILDESRSGSVPDEFFAGSIGVLMTDRYSAYKGLHDGIRKAWCWVHVRRDFLKIFAGVKKLRAWAKAWLEDIAMLFVLNEKRFRLWTDQKNYGQVWQEAQSNLAAHVQNMETHWQNEVRRIGLHKEQKTALNSLKRHWTGLTMFLLDPRIPLHNNRAERLLRNPVILRKNSYGSGSKWSGGFAAKMFSIFQTWLLHGLDPEALLHDYFDQASRPGRPPPNLDEFLPWRMSPERLQNFSLPKSYKRPG